MVLLVFLLFSYCSGFPAVDGALLLLASLLILVFLF
jgi:hypothetical protein